MKENNVTKVSIATQKFEVGAEANSSFVKNKQRIN